ncbi:hypothetical protein HPB51_019929 [Rhipicephalus microplus]|uniref:Helitron helicase-like domain-containing protein n=1 Tax=Rhipicephalus microplus TaxID=6941 RepID=A0A9J6E472_RHIMP|nr:hypothetical protein HPB51_019929 [Rhipicephalus microplus]
MTGSKAVNWTTPLPLTSLLISRIACTSLRVRTASHWRSSWMQYAEELAFLTICMGVPREIIGPRSTLFAMASSEIRRTDWRGATPEHVLYIAAKVMRYNVAESNMMFRTNETTVYITREQLESGGKKFLEEVQDRDLAFMRGVPNTVQYWQDRRNELFAMIHQLGKPHAFLTTSASEVHWERLLETLEQAAGWARRHASARVRDDDLGARGARE